MRRESAGWMHARGDLVRCRPRSSKDLLYNTATKLAEARVGADHPTKRPREVSVLEYRAVAAHLERRETAHTVRTVYSRKRTYVHQGNRRLQAGTHTRLRLRGKGRAMCSRTVSPPHGIHTVPAPSWHRVTCMRGLARCARRIHYSSSSKSSATTFSRAKSTIQQPLWGSQRLPMLCGTRTVFPPFSISTVATALRRSTR